MTACWAVQEARIVKDLDAFIWCDYLVMYGVWCSETLGRYLEKKRDSPG